MCVFEQIIGFDLEKRGIRKYIKRKSGIGKPSNGRESKMDHLRIDDSKVGP